MLIVLIQYKNGTTDIKACFTVDDICLDGVDTIKVIKKVA